MLDIDAWTMLDIDAWTMLDIYAWTMLEIYMLGQCRAMAAELEFEKEA